jgi:hypothetical protein
MRGSRKDTAASGTDWNAGDFRLQAMPRFSFFRNSCRSQRTQRFGITLMRKQDR